MWTLNFRTHSPKAEDRKKDNTSLHTTTEMATDPLLKESKVLRELFLGADFRRRKAVDETDSGELNRLEQELQDCREEIDSLKEVNQSMKVRYERELLAKDVINKGLVNENEQWRKINSVLKEEVRVAKEDIKRLQKDREDLRGELQLLIFASRKILDDAEFSNFDLQIARERTIQELVQVLQSNPRNEDEEQEQPQKQEA